MIDKVFIQMINIYQKYISPYKGYSCAYRAYSGNLSCSEFAKNEIKNNGFFKSLPLIKKLKRKKSRKI